MKQIIDTRTIDQEQYFLRAKAGLVKCFEDPENAHLHEELECPFSDVELENDRIRINLNDEGFDSLEVLVDMTFDNVELGYYVLIYDMENNIIDDVLVIHECSKSIMEFIN